MEESPQQGKHLKGNQKVMFTSFNQHLDHRTISFLKLLCFNVLVTTQSKEP